MNKEKETTKEAKKSKNKTKPKTNKQQNKTPVITLTRKVRAAKHRTLKKVIKDDPSNWEDLWGSSLSCLCSDQTEAVSGRFARFTVPAVHLSWEFVAI